MGIEPIFLPLVFTAIAGVCDSLSLITTLPRFISILSAIDFVVERFLCKWLNPDDDRLAPIQIKMYGFCRLFRVI